MRPSIARHAVLFSLAAVLVVAGCGSDGAGIRPANRPPTVTLTASPVEGDTVDYRVTISWSAEDPDGRVAGFRWAVDPPEGFTEAEIDSGGPGVVSELHPGSGGAPDTTRVSKTADGETLSFDWVHTREYSRRFLFHTPDADTTLFDGYIPVPTGIFTGMHRVYVRAVDDQGALSDPARLALTARTVAPSAEILRPASDPATSSFHVGTSGSRPLDRLRPGRRRARWHRPAGYLYKLVERDPGAGRG